MQSSFTIECDIFYYNVFSMLDNDNMLKILLLNKTIRIRYWKRYCQLRLLMNLPFDLNNFCKLKRNHLNQYILNIKDCSSLNHINKLLNIQELKFKYNFNKSIHLLSRLTN